MLKDAVLSKDGQYRYALVRVWNRSKPRMTFIGFNPEVNQEQDHNILVGRCIEFAKREGMGGIHLVNLFGYLGSTQELKQAVDPVGPSNDFWLRAAFQHNGHGLIVGMWGTRAPLERINMVKKIAVEAKTPIYALGVSSSNGAPHSLLKIAYDQPLVRWYR